MPLPVKEKILRIKDKNQAKRSLLGKLLLQDGLSSINKDASLTKLKISVYGKPYLDDDVDFSISHSFNVIICILSTVAKVGIDVELVRKMRLDSFETIFSSCEWGNIICSNTPEEVFFSYWTAKEAVAKAAGKGLHLPFNKIEVNDEIARIGNDHWHISSIEHFHSYSLHIASNRLLTKKLKLTHIPYT